MNNIFQYIIENSANGKIEKEAAVKMIKMMKTDKVKVEDDIAVIGMDSKFPYANDVCSFWQNIRNSRDCIMDFPEERRKDTDAFLRNVKRKTSETEYRIGGFLDEIDKFDYRFFKMSPKEASMMDPNQRLFLQTAYHAMEDAGYGDGKLSGSRTGVYLGYSSDFNDSYKTFLQAAGFELDGSAMAGNMGSIIASRISFCLNLKGPSISVDAACASSLAAIHLACQSIKSGECDMALAGAVKLCLLPVEGNGDSMNIMSAYGRTRSFEDSSDGTGLGEGCAVVMLKPLKKAVKDRDNIYAVIKGSAVNQNGESMGITAPNSAAQEDVIVKAWKDAGIDPETISYVEAQGIGTQLGDLIEFDGIESAFRRYTDKMQFCAMGSVKTNIGHLDNASGMAAFLKSVMALKHKEIPPMLHFDRPSRKINMQESPVYISDRLTKWETDGGVRRCGIQSFGIGGTNSHVILEEAPIQGDSSSEPKSSGDSQGPYILPISAKSETALVEYISKYKSLLDSTEEIELENICYTASTGKGHFPFRIAIMAEDMEDMKNKLSYLAGTTQSKMNSAQIYALSEFVQKHDSYTAIQSIPAVLDTQPVSDKMNETLEQHMNEHKTVSRLILDELLRAYVSGASIQWETLYAGRKVRKVTLPGYPFERLRCWITFPDVVDSQEYVEESIVEEKQAPMPNAVLEGKVTDDYTQLELAIGAIWYDTLGIRELNIHTNFADLGGNSLLTITVAKKLKEQFDVELDLNELFTNYSISSLAQYMEEHYPEAVNKLTEQSDDKDMEEDRTEEPFVRAAVNKVNIKETVISQISGLMWRQMNCLDRGFGLLIAPQNEERLSLYQLFIGMKRCFDLKEYKKEIFSEQSVYKEYLVETQLLENFGFGICMKEIENIGGMQDVICQSIDEGKPVIVNFDEYYIFYSSYYQLKHTTHLAVIYGYDRNKKLYMIVDYNHLVRVNSKEFDYGIFTVPFETMEAIYLDDSNDKKILTVEQDREVDNSYLLQEMKETLEYVAKNQLLSQDLAYIRSIMTADESELDADFLDKLYLYIGGKELLFHTICSHFMESSVDCKNLADDILKDSVSMVNLCSMSVIRKKKISSSRAIAGYLEKIEHNTQELITRLNEMEFRYREAVD